MVTEKEKREKAWDLITNIQTGMMTTLGLNEQMTARPMSHVEKEFVDNKIVYFSDDDTLKVYELKNNSDVMISYSDISKNQFVNVNGKAKIIKDLNKYLEYWSDEMDKWYPKGIKDPKLCMIIVDVDKIEYWDNDVNPIKKAYTYFVANLKNERPSIGEHESVSLN